MALARSIPRRSAIVPTTAFASAEEAWFWFVRCQQVRREGAQLGDGRGDLARPCDPDDIYRAAMGLARRGVLRPSHLHVLGTYGLHGCPPDARCRDENAAARLWDEALDRLSTVFRAKGIVA